MLLTNKHIFIVEDNIMNYAIIKTILQTNGAILTHDRWGKEALVRIKDMEQIDLILLDLTLDGETSGYDVFEQIKADAELCDIPIVAVSASGELKKTREMGFTGYIGKPIDRYTFPQAVAAILDGKSIWGDSLDL